MARGRLIVFEGGEGAGKSTQLARLAGHLTRLQLPFRSFREPGGTPVGDRIRAVLLDPAAHVSARTEALLFMASRAELVSREVRPALAQGGIVLLDRFFLSTYAYQIEGRGLPDADVRSANLMATEGLVPDLTLLLKMDAREGMRRANRRGDADRMEASGDDFHLRVQEAFAKFATPGWQAGHEECGPIVAVDATGAETDVEARVLDAVTARFSELRALQGVVA